MRLHVGAGLISCCLVLCSLPSPGSRAAEGPVNLMPNSGFEQVTKSGLPSGWWQHPGELDPEVASISVDESVRHSGERSVKAEVKSEQNIALIYTTLKPFNQGDTLHLSIHYRSNRRRPDRQRGSNDYSASRALVSFAYHFRGAYVSKKVHGKDVTDGWEKLEATCVVPAHHAKDDFNELTIKLLMQNGLGDVWWDDLAVRRLNRYSVNLAPYAETVLPGPNALSVVMENYTGAKESLRCELSLDGNVVARKSFSSTGETTQRLSIDYETDVVGEHTLGLSLMEGKGDEVLFSAEKKIDVADRLETGVLRPTHVWPERNVAEVVQTIKVNLAPGEISRSKLRVRVRREGETVKEDILRCGPEPTVYRFPVHGIAPGDYTTVVTLLGGDGEVLATKEGAFHIMDRPKSVLAVKDGILLRDGRPFFPIGMYGMGRYDGSYREFADAGFNFVHTYAFSGRFGDEETLVSEEAGIELMDRIAADGMLILMETPRFKLSRGDIDGLRSRYQALSTHPACLFYYEEESFIHGHASYENARKWVSLLRELHPQGLICLADWLHIDDKADDPRPAGRRKAYGEELRFPEELCDVGVDYWYPFPPPEGQTEIVVPTWLEHHMDTDKPIWVAPQSNERHWIKHPPERAKRQRWPLPKEYRLQAYLSVIHGATGLFYFGHHFVGKEREAHWGDLKKVVAEISDLSPVILAPTSELAVTISGSDKLDTVLKTHEGALYLIAAHREVGVVDAEFRFPFTPAEIKVKYEGREITPAGNGFRDTFDRYGVHVYEIRAR